MTDPAPLTLDQWLGKIYNADIKNNRAPQIALFKTALAGDSDLTTKAKLKLKELDDLIKVRGRQACTFSAKYWDYLNEAFA